MDGHYKNKAAYTKTRRPKDPQKPQRPVSSVEGQKYRVCEGRGKGCVKLMVGDEGSREGQTVKRSMEQSGASQEGRPPSPGLTGKSLLE